MDVFTILLINVFAKKVLSDSLIGAVSCLVFLKGVRNFVIRCSHTVLLKAIRKFVISCSRPVLLKCKSVAALVLVKAVRKFVIRCSRPGFSKSY